MYGILNKNRVINTRQETPIGSIQDPQTQGYRGRTNKNEPIWIGLTMEKQDTVSEEETDKQIRMVLDCCVLFIIKLARPLHVQSFFYCGCWCLAASHKGGAVDNLWRREMSGLRELLPLTLLWSPVSRQETTKAAKENRRRCHLLLESKVGTQIENSINFENLNS